jgi:hypothetical protein
MAGFEGPFVLEGTATADAGSPPALPPMRLSFFPQFQIWPGNAPQVPADHRILFQPRGLAILVAALLAAAVRLTAESGDSASSSAAGSIVLHAAQLEQTISFSAPSGLFTGSLSVSLTGAGENQKIRYTLTAPSASN